MSENRNRGIQDYSKYDSMKTEELEEILRLDAERSDGEESDVELLLYVMGVLADRRRNNEVTGKTALEAYESFMRNYLPEEENIDTAPETEATPKIKPIRWLRGLAAAAAVLVFVILGSVTANALGFDVWEVVATWAQETFHFGSGEQCEVDMPQANDNLPYSSLQDALAEANISSDLLPTWLPDGYEIADISIEQTPIQEIYVTIYKNGDKYLKIVVQSYLNGYPEQIEQSEDLVEVYEVAGVMYYIFSNYEQTRAAWISDSYECYVSGELTVDQLEMMIESIGKGEH